MENWAFCLLLAMSQNLHNPINLSPPLNTILPLSLYNFPSHLISLFLIFPDKAINFSISFSLSSNFHNHHPISLS